jgi:RimJ/RimL family protein N-acetyltransferase
MTIRVGTPGDAVALLELKLALDRETSFMLLEPGERQDTPEELTAHLRAVGEQANSTVLVAEEGGELVGYVEAEGGRYRRTRHCAYVVIGVRAAVSGRGVGTALLEALSAWAGECGVSRLELTVMRHNDRAVALYRRCGYEIEGTRRASVRVDGGYVDELAMARVRL